MKKILGCIVALFVLSGTGLAADKGEEQDYIIYHDTKKEHVEIPKKDLYSADELYREISEGSLKIKEKHKKEGERFFVKGRILWISPRKESVNHYVVLRGDRISTHLLAVFSDDAKDIEWKLLELNKDVEVVILCEYDKKSDSLIAHDIYKTPRVPYAKFYTFSEVHSDIDQNLMRAIQKYKEIGEFFLRGEVHFAFYDDRVKKYRITLNYRGSMDVLNIWFEYDSVGEKLLSLTKGQEVVLSVEHTEQNHFKGYEIHTLEDWRP